LVTIHYWLRQWYGGTPHLWSQISAPHSMPTFILQFSVEAFVASPTKKVLLVFMASHSYGVVMCGEQANHALYSTSCILILHLSNMIFLME
jgi:hypothetical protein